MPDSIPSLVTACKHFARQHHEDLATGMHCAAATLSIQIPHSKPSVSPLPYPEDCSKIQKQRWRSFLTSRIPENKIRDLQHMTALLEALVENRQSATSRQHSGIVYTPGHEIQRIIRLLFTYLPPAFELSTICDPACGTGGFLKGLLDYLDAAASPRPSLALAGNDTDPVAVAAARQILGTLTQSDDSVVLQTGDSLAAFSSAEQTSPCHWKKVLSHSGATAHGGFDLVISNPPYVRHELFSRKRQAHVLADLKEWTASEFNSFSVAQGLDNLPGRGDIYVWFFAAGLTLTRPGGVLCYITPDSWLDAVYGQKLQQLLLLWADEIVIEQTTGVRTFRSAGISSAITMVRKAVKTPAATVRFMRHSWAEPTRPPHISTVAVPPPGKWGSKYLRPGPMVRQLLSHAGMIPLSSLAKLTYGTKPGIKDFFVLTTEQPDGREIEGRFLEPVLTSVRELTSASVANHTPHHYLFVCLLELNELTSSGSTGALKYIREAEGRVTRRQARHTSGGVPYPQVPSVRDNRPQWYCLRPSPPGDFLIPCMIDKRFVISRNPHGLQATNMFFHGHFNPGLDPDAACAMLNSSYTWLMMENFGRIKGLGGLNLYGPDLAAVPVPDVRQIPEPEKALLAEAFRTLCGRPVEPVNRELGTDGQIKSVLPDRLALDLIVTRILGLDEDVLSLVYSELIEVVRCRLRLGGKQ
jgi:methylase of polypeptide subunit release factors